MMSSVKKPQTTMTPYIRLVNGESGARENTEAAQARKVQSDSQFFSRSKMLIHRCRRRQAVLDHDVWFLELLCRRLGSGAFRPPLC